MTFLLSFAISGHVNCTPKSDQISLDMDWRFNTKEATELPSAHSWIVDAHAQADIILDIGIYVFLTDLIP